MKTTYFTPAPTTPDEARSRYRELALQWHPDINPSTEATTVMQAINAEYAALLADLANHSERQRQQAAHAAGRKTNADFVDLDAVTETLRQVIEALLDLPEIEIELCGL